jgi:ABC-type bacteriocin/lantibiotic exporter with double-glycine peptidase domain
MELEKYPKLRNIAKKLLRLEDRLFGRPFPAMERVEEISNYACGPATLQMLLSFVGVKTSQTKLIRSIRVQKKIRTYGLNIKEMAKAANIAGKKDTVFWVKQNASLGDIQKALIKYGYPVGVEWQGEFYENEDEDKGHYSVITKINKKSGFMRISDPYFNSFYRYLNLDRKFPVKKFIKMWWDTNEIKTGNSSKTRTVKDIRLMFLITKKGEKWPKDLGMLKK